MPPAINRLLSSGLDRTSLLEGFNQARGFASPEPRVFVWPRPCSGAGAAAPRHLSGLRLAAREQVEDGPPGKGETGRGGRRRWTALQQLLPASDSPVSAMPLEQSHTALWGGRGHRVPLLGPWGPSWEIPGSALPSPPPRSPCRGGGNASRAQTPPPPPPLRPPAFLRLGACCCRRRRWTRRLEKRRESCQSPRLEESSLQPRCAPRLPRPSPGYPRTPARPGRVPGSERAAAQVGASWGLAHDTPPPPPGASRPSPTSCRPLRSRAGGKAGLGHSRGVPAVLVAQGVSRERKLIATSLSPSWTKAKPSSSERHGSSRRHPPFAPPSTPARGLRISVLAPPAKYF